MLKSSEFGGTIVAIFNATIFFNEKGIMDYEIKLLKTAGYTDKEISNMSQHVRRNLALEIEMLLKCGK